MTTPEKPPLTDIPRALDRVDRRAVTRLLAAARPVSTLTIAPPAV